LLLYASTLNRGRERTMALAVLGLHGLIEALTLENSGQLDQAEVAARHSAECFEAVADEWWIVEPLGILAGIAEYRGDLDGAAAAYEAVVERSRAVGAEFFEPRWLSRLAAVRARQGDHAEADRLYGDTTANGRNPLLTASALVAQASVVRRLGDLPRARRLLDDGMARYQLLGVTAGCAGALAGLAWWTLAAGDQAGAATFAERARVTARSSGDPHTELVAESAVAAVAVVADPSEQHRVELGAIAERRRFAGGVYAAILDELDVAALTARYPPSSSAPVGR
jgi:tetratricopeptide (TPR) repeat protein